MDTPTVAAQTIILLNALPTKEVLVTSQPIVTQHVKKVTLHIKVAAMEPFTVQELDRTDKVTKDWLVTKENTMLEEVVLDMGEAAAMGQGLFTAQDYMDKVTKENIMLGEVVLGMKEVEV